MNMFFNQQSIITAAAIFVAAAAVSYGQNPLFTPATRSSTTMKFLKQ